jgi:hypothetical protein
MVPSPEGLTPGGVDSGYPGSFAEMAAHGFPDGLPPGEYDYVSENPVQNQPGLIAPGEEYVQ